MSVKIVQKVWVLALISAVIAGGLLYHFDALRQKNIRGNSLFAAAENLQEVKKIEISLPENTLTLYEDENLWRLLEADNYYVDLKVLQRLQEEIASGKVRKAENETKNLKDLQWSTVKLFDGDGNKLDEVQIANATELGLHYVRYPSEQQVYLSNWHINLPDELTAWTRQPLVDFNGLDVSSFTKNGIKIVRRDEGETFMDADTRQLYHQYDYIKVFDALTNLWYEQVLSVQNFDDKKYQYHQHLQTETFNGLITDFEVYTDYQEYWLKVNLSQSRLSKVETVEYVKNNAYWYKDWWFKLPTNIGRTLFMFKFNV